MKSRKTIEALQRLADRPGTPAEGVLAKAMLERFRAGEVIPKPFSPDEFPAGTRIFYCYWCYRNEPGTVCKQPAKPIRGEWWVRVKFDSIKQPRWVPVTSNVGVHISATPFGGDEAETMYRMDRDWEEKDRQMIARFRSVGIIRDCELSA